MQQIEQLLTGLHPAEQARLTIFSTWFAMIPESQHYGPGYRGCTARFLHYDVPWM